VQVLERLLAAQGVTDGAPLDMLGRMKRQVSRMATLVANVLDVSRLRLGTMQLDAAPTDLAELVTQAAERLREQFVQEGTPLTVMASESITGQWDRLRLEQVVLNLLSNALKYGDHQPVRVVVDGDADSARLTVRDHGSGIPVDEQIRIFDRGARVRGERRPGHGLGLWITRTIVDAHGGKITIESSPGLGSTFVVELPRAEQASSRPSALRALLSGARQEGAAQSRR
jgi:signal transduction histidine kinase